MQPSLAIAYDSRSGNGPLGVGWSLTGFSVIQRCKKTLAQDSSNDAPSWQSTDRYCLDGNKLRLTGGSYGLASSTYQTEVDEFSRVTAEGNSTSGRGPDHWIAQGRNGLSYEYGDTSQSRDVVSAPSIWQLDKVTDRAGNYMTISYNNQDAPYVDWILPSSIVYASNDGTETAGASSVVFQWAARPTTDLVTAATVNGAALRNTQLLQAIDIYESGTLIRVYKLTYNNSGSGARSRLSSVQECDGNGNCLIATQIGWQSGTAGYGTDTTIANLGALASYAIPVDLNSDARTDVIYPSGSYWAYMLANSSGGYGTPVVTTTAHNGKYASALVIDYFGNGKQELLVPDASGNWSLLQFNGSGFTTTALKPGGVSISASTQSWVGDVNGDGYPDLVYLNAASTQLLCRFNSASGFSSTVSTLYTAPAGTTIYLYTTTMSFNLQATLNQGDFNGDGRTDLLVGFIGTGPKMLLSTGTSYVDSGYVFSDSSGTSIVGTTWRTLDANGDGIDDLAFVDSSGAWKVLYGVPAAAGAANFGTAVTSSITSPATAGGTAVLPLDWDGDGRVDILAANTTPSPGTHWFLIHATGDSLSTSQEGTGSFSGTASTDTGILTAQTGTMIVDVNGDGLLDLVYADTSHNWHVLLHKGPTPDLVTSITDAFGNYVQMTYAPLTDSTVYTEGSGATYPQQDLLVPLYVVKQYTENDGIGGTYSVNETYTAARVDMTGRGFLGFTTRKETDSRTGITTTWTYRQDFPFIGSLSQLVVAQPSAGPTIFKSSNTWTSAELDSTTNNQRWFPELTNVTSLQYEVGGTKNGLLMTTASKTFAYDAFGNANTVTAVLTDNDSGSPYVGDTWTTTTTSTPDVDQTNWCLPLDTEVQVAYTASNGSTSVTRTKQFTPDTVKCRYNEIVIEPGSSTYRVTEDFGYDAFGNTSSDKITGIGMAARTTLIDWGTTGRYRMSITDPMSAKTQYTYNFGLGTNTGVTDPNNITTSWMYDSFGRKSQESRPDGTYTMWTYTDCAATSCLIGTHGFVVTQTVYGVGGGVVTDGTSYEDSLDRELVSSQRLLATGTYDRNEKRYDNLGRVLKQAAPCAWSGLTTTCTYWTTNYYDLLNRVTSTQRPINASNGTLQSTTYTYAGRTTTVTDSQSVAVSTVRDVNGWLRSTTDQYAYTVTLGYDAAGAHVGTSDSLGNTLWSSTYAYGASPFVISTTDMDLGTRTYVVDALGERTSWKDANLQTFSMTYDAISRPLVRTEPDLFTQWTYGTSAANHNIGKLQSVCVDNPPSCSSTAYVETDTYDSLGRAYQKTFNELIYSGYNSYTYTQLYNSTTGLLDTLTYPTSTSSFALKLKYGYQNGLLQSITDVASSPNVIVWTASATNPARQITSETLGNQIVTTKTYDAVTHWMASLTAGIGGGAGVKNLAYLYDQDGNVTQREDIGLGLTENFYYDNDYRLYSSKLNNVQNLSIGYDVTGNITSRSDVAGGATWTYDPVHKHQVTQAGSSAYQYSYDANGNALTRQGNSALWWSSNYPECIPNDCGATNEGVMLIYGQDRQRIQQVYTSSGGSQEWTNYVGPLEIVSSSTLNDFRHYIYAGAEPVAIYSRKSTGTNSYSYLLTDYQGSVIAITNASGGLTIGESFTAYGNRRNPTTWSGAASNSDLSTIAGISREGYTFQTALGLWLDLNHMNGRVEDAITGRFLSADPNVQDLSNTQSFNRYSYVNNNPMTLSDPTGFFSWGDLLNPFSDNNPLNPFGHLGRILALAPFDPKIGDQVLRKNPWLQTVGEIAACYFGPYACAAADAYVTRLNGGSLLQAGEAGFFGYLFYNADLTDTTNWAGQAFERGFTQGVLAGVLGGDPVRGFEYGFAGSLALSGYQSLTGGYSPDPNPGQDVTPTVDTNLCGTPGASCYRFDPLTQKVPDDYVTINIFGTNEGGTGCLAQSQLCSRILDKFPLFQAIALAHDNLIGSSVDHVAPWWFNYPTMLPVAVLTYGAFLNTYGVPRSLTGPYYNIPSGAGPGLVH